MDADRFEMVTEADVRAAALEVYRPEGIDIWYDAPNRLLNNATPRRFVETGDGTRVLALIAAMADGVAT